MKFVIKPDSNDFNLILEAQAYRKVWRQHSRSIMKAFREVTGLEFPQSMITARVFNGQVSNSGRLWVPMKLAADYRPPEEKLVTIVHELSHRLLNGNGLGLAALGLREPYAKKNNQEEMSPQETEMDHRHMYLFEYDVVYSALGEQWAATLVEYEKSCGSDTPYGIAWRWAMNKNRAQRQIAVKRLVSMMPQVESWDDYDITKVAKRDPEDWYRYLDGK